MRLSVLVVGVSCLAACRLAEPPPPGSRVKPPSTTQPPATNAPPNLPPPQPGFCPSPANTVVEAGEIVEPATAPPAISGGTLAVLADGTLAAADSDRDLLYLVSEDRTFRTIALQPHDEPGRVASGAPGRAFVVLRRAGKVAEIDVAAGTVVARHDACPAPRGLAWLEAKQQLVVACATGDLARLTFAGGALAQVQRSHPADDLRDVTVDGNQLVVSTFREARLVSVTDDGKVTALPAPKARASLGPSSEYRVHQPRVAWRTVGVASGTYMVHQRAQESALAVASVQCKTPSYGGSAAAVDALGVLHSVVTKVSYGQVFELATIRDAVLPVDLAVAPDESTVVVASPGSGVHLVRGNSESLLLTVTPNAQFTAVAYWDGKVVAFSREPAMLYFVEPRVGADVTTLALSPVSVKSTGHDLFHRQTANAIACASCHPEGGEDGHVWVLPEGRRRTPSLRGGLTGTEPFHWSGDQVSMPDLMSDVLVKRMGGAAQTPERAKAALAWLDALPKLPAPVLDAAAVERGKALFASPTIGCASCHSGALGTNNANANVGTGSLMQVPRMVELAYRAPFFHDGRVATLADRFTAAGGGDNHGLVSTLTAAQQADLVTYLKSR